MARSVADDGRKRWFLPLVALALFALLALALAADAFLPVVVLGNLALLGVLVWLGTEGLRAVRATERAAHEAARSLGLARDASAEGPARGYPCEAVTQAFRGRLGAVEIELVLGRDVGGRPGAIAWLAAAPLALDAPGLAPGVRFVGPPAPDDGVASALLPPGGRLVADDRAAAEAWLAALPAPARSAVDAFLASGSARLGPTRAFRFVGAGRARGAAAFREALESVAAVARALAPDAAERGP
ncbi:MAG: hypothetical protein IT373_20090 [Polyangiaceae bacterium]|nr:hypothetical protein [Polyangiaceae bacterium]